MHGTKTLITLALVALVSLGCQAMAKHDYENKVFTHSISIGDGTIDNSVGKSESEGLSVPGEKFVSKVLDTSLNIGAAFAPGFVGQAIRPTDPQPIVINVPAQPQPDPPPDE